MTEDRIKHIQYRLSNIMAFLHDRDGGKLISRHERQVIEWYIEDIRYLLEYVEVKS